MNEKIIPEHIDPFRYAEQGIQIEGVALTEQMPRLLTNIMPSDEPVHVTLRLGIDEQGIYFIKGHLNIQLNLQCQRCMNPLNYEVTSDFALGIVNTLNEAKTLPSEYEPILAKEGSLALRELVEDEIILNLPIIPRHELTDCAVKVSYVESSTETGQNERKNPFKVLESLKHNKDNY